MFNTVSKRHLSPLRLIKDLKQRHSTAKRLPITITTIIFTQMQMTPPTTNDTTHTIIIKHAIIKPVRTIPIIIPHSVPNLP